MKIKVVIILVFLLGIFITIIGALFKIQHWPYGAEILTAGLLIEALVILLVILKLVLAKKPKDSSSN